MRTPHWASKEPWGIMEMLIWASLYQNRACSEQCLQSNTNLSKDNQLFFLLNCSFLLSCVILQHLRMLGLAGTAQTVNRVMAQERCQRFECQYCLPVMLVGEKWNPPSPHSPFGSLQLKAVRKDEISDGSYSFPLVLKEIEVNTCKCPTNQLEPQLWPSWSCWQNSYLFQKSCCFSFQNVIISLLAWVLQWTPLEVMKS